MTRTATVKATTEVTTITPAILHAAPIATPPHIELDIHLAEQARLLREIIHMMVGIDVEPSSSVWPPPGEDLVEARVRFSGPWPGAMIFESTLPLSFEFTARFMTVALPEAMNDDVRDAHGELANMIAGNFKALLPPGSHISIPEVRLCPHAAPVPEALPGADRQPGAELLHGNAPFAGPKPPTGMEPFAGLDSAGSLSQSVFHTRFGGCCLKLENIGA